MMDAALSILLRTTACTMFAAGAALLLFRLTRVRSPIVHRLVWILVLLQGWIFFPVVCELPFGPSSPDETTGLVPVAVTSTEQVVEQSSAGSLYTDFSPPSARVEPTPWLCILWAGGAVVVVLLGLGRYLALWHRVPLGRAPHKNEWHNEWETVARSSGVARRACFRLTDDMGPLCCFVPFFYLVLAPEKLWSSLSARQRQAILWHECAHLRRGDLWKSVAIRLLALPQWFNPLAWKAVRACDEAAEWACDDFALKALGEEHATSYPQALLCIAETHLAPLPGSAAARGGALSARIRRLVSSHVMEDTLMKKLVLPALFLGLMACQSIRMQIVAAEQTDTEPAAVVPVLPSPAPEPAAEVSPKRKTDLARSGLAPYRVAPPDVLVIAMSPKSSDKAPPEVEEQHLVFPDGTIHFGKYGKLNVAGRTVREIEKAVGAHLGRRQYEGTVRVDVVASNSKAVFVIVPGNPGDGDRVIRVRCTPDTDLHGVLSQLSWPHPRYLEQAKIHVSRPGENGSMEQLIPVDWHEISTQKESLPLLPGDRIFVAKIGPPAPTPRKVEQREETASDQITLRIQVIHDPHGNLQEFEALQRGNMMWAETKPALATLRILSRNDLVQTIAAPTIVCQSGNEAGMSMEGSPFDGIANVEGISIEVTPTILDASHIVLATQIELLGVDGNLDARTEFVVAEEHSVFMRVHPAPHAYQAPASGEAIYVALTPERSRN